MNKNLLKSEIVKNGLTQGRLAKLLGMSETTFCRKMKTGVFGSDEVKNMLSALHIKNPETAYQIFFAD